MKAVFNPSFIILPSGASIYSKTSNFVLGEILQQSQGFKFINSIMKCVHVGVCAGILIQKF